MTAAEPQGTAVERAAPARPRPPEGWIRPLVGGLVLVLLAALHALHEADLLGGYGPWQLAPVAVGLALLTAAAVQAARGAAGPAVWEHLIGGFAMPVALLVAGLIVLLQAARRRDGAAKE